MIGLICKVMIFYQSSYWVLPKQESLVRQQKQNNSDSVSLLPTKH